MGKIAKFKKGQVVNFTFTIEENFTTSGVVLRKSRRFPGAYTVRFKTPLLLKEGKKTRRGFYEATVKEDSMEINTIETLKSIMRRK